MSKFLILSSHKNKSQRRTETSMANMKALIEARVAKDPEDTSYTVLTVDIRPTLKVVRDLTNKSFSALCEMDGVKSVEEVTIDPSKQRGRWTVTPVAVEKKAKKKKLKKKEAA